MVNGDGIPRCVWCSALACVASIGGLAEGASTADMPGGPVGASCEDQIVPLRAEMGEWAGVPFLSGDGVIHYGWGRLNMGASDSGSAIPEIAWQDLPHIAAPVSYVPAAGPLVLVGMATLIGGPRRRRLAQSQCARPAS